MKFAKSSGRFYFCFAISIIMVNEQCKTANDVKHFALSSVLMDTCFLSGGLLGIFNMFAAYQRWCRTTSVRAQYFERMLEMCGLIDDPECPKAGKHRELEPAQIKKSEAAVHRTIAAIKSFTNPFTIADKNRLYNLASGAPVSPEVETDVLLAEVTGKAAKDKFIKERFMNGSESSFFDPIKRLKLLTMEACNKKVTLTSVQGKVKVY